MNDIVRTNIKERLVKAIESEKLLAQDVAAIFQMHPSYISWFKNVKYWDKIGEKFWERVLAWINSGQSLREWSEKHGKVLNENSPTDTKRDKTGTEKKEIVSEPVNPEPKPLITIKPGVLEKRKEEIAVKERRASRGEMVDMLITEKESLRAKIEAIDVLLKHYIS